MTNTIETETLKPLPGIQFEIAEWNFDIKDCGNILRINSLKEIAQPIIKILKDNDFEYQEG